MIPPNEFWLSLHALAEAYDGEGLSPDERSQHILDQFRRMPPTVRRQVLGDLQRLMFHMEDLVVAAVAAAREEDSRQPIPQNRVG